MKELNSLMRHLGFTIMLKQSNKEGFLASNIKSSKVIQKGCNYFKISSSGELIDERRVRRVIMFEAHFIIFIKSDIASSESWQFFISVRNGTGLRNRPALKRFQGFSGDDFFESDFLGRL